jgi:hypothetical protein
VAPLAPYTPDPICRWTEQYKQEKIERLHLIFVFIEYLDFTENRHIARLTNPCFYLQIFLPGEELNLRGMVVVVSSPGLAVVISKVWQS